ncbi:MAG TPA: AAA family ATPase, partial [Noviherbaspirillum sp.]|uniref:AAA family ATPase n=1 Tax=Noviherbaspirillum sp. TaxID=1926288 RepID=UPI002D458559
GQIEQFTTDYPKTAVILLCATQTPEFLINAMRAGVREVLPSPVPAGALEAAVTRVAAKLKGAQGKAAGKVLAFMPCKGGSGSTFLATNLGYQLAESHSVLLIDLNLQFGDALSFIHDGKPASTLADVARDIHRLDASFLAASTVKVTPNYSVLAAPEEPSQAVDIAAEHVEAVLDLAASEYDFILLDLGRNLDTLSIKALDRTHRIFPVLQTGLPALRNAKRLLAAFAGLGYPSEKTEIIVNRFEKHGEVGLDDIRRLLGVTTLHTVPNSYKEVNAAINHGEPLPQRARSSAVTKGLAALSMEISPRKEESTGLLGRLFRRAPAAAQRPAHQS